ncbi:CCA tRNA nucleotidyltransferase [Candidatus Micrarchaeota archaeon]|nr:CCA tRNA nucleotidyltransferase [Candidatus Micrarchaeota archaeon]
MGKQLLSDVLSVIKPNLRELGEETRFAAELVDRISKNAPPDTNVVLTGSIAKKTFLRHHRDIDVFILFSRSVPKEKLGPAVREVMVSAFPKTGYQLSYAEHPYIRFHYKGRKVDLVPAYRISKAEERMSAVDRSVLHTRYVKKHLSAEQRDDVLLLKQFLRANEIYGAEIKIKGFSGYLCELLIIKYGSFPRLVKAAAKWKPPVFIDLEKYHSKKNIPHAIGRFGDFVVIDPTDSERNVAAAVSTDNFRKFISLCRSFIKKPSKRLFFRKPLSFEQRLSRARGNHKLVVSMPRPDVVDDVLWGQLHRLIRMLSNHLSEFKPKKIIADDSRHLVRLGIVLEKGKLSPRMLVPGPPLEMKENVKRFKSRHRGAKFIKKKNRLYAERKRPAREAETAMKMFFRKFSESDSHLAYPEEMVVIRVQ